MRKKGTIIYLLGITSILVGGLILYVNVTEIIPAVNLLGDMMIPYPEDVRFIEERVIVILYTMVSPITFGVMLLLPLKQRTVKLTIYMLFAYWGLVTLMSLVVIGTGVYFMINVIEGMFLVIFGVLLFVLVIIPFLCSIFGMRTLNKMKD